MSDSDLSKLLSRLATLEAEVSGYRKAAAPAAPAGLDPNQLRQQMVTDPVGALQRLGLPADHITKILVAHAMGDSAPTELKVLASMGPQMSATHALQAKVEELAGKLSSYDASHSKQGTRTSFQALTKDKTKYPHLAKAFAEDPELFYEELESHGGNAEDFASKMEARQARIAKVYGVTTTPPASTESADTNDHSEQDKPDAAGQLTSGNPPPIPARGGKGPMTADEDKALRDEILKKYSGTK